jgi:hypothetical protein
MYADTTSGILFADAGSNRTQVIFTYTTAGSITNFTPKSYPGPLIIPGILGGVTVTSIGEAVFSACSYLMSITIPDSLESIGQAAFANCENLRSVTFGSGSQLKTILLNAFFNCNVLSSITIPVSVTSIHTQVFTYSGLTDVNVSQGFLTSNNLTAGSNQPFYGKSSGVTIVGYKLFKSVGALTGATAQLNGATLAIIEGYSSIGANAFLDAASLTAITIPASVTSIGISAFINCSHLTSVTFHPNSQLLTIGDWAFKDCTSLASIAIPASVTTIGGNVFNRCAALTSFVIPALVTSISNNAFQSCTGLTSVIIPASVTSIGDAAFINCSSLTSVTFPSGSQLLTIGSHAFDSCSNLNSIVIPASVTSIGERAFTECSSLTSIIIPASVTSISYDAFGLCINLATLTFASGSQLTTIGEFAFRRCTSLRSIIIPNSVITISNGAFEACYTLESIIIPASVTSIGDGAFFSTSLVSITVPASVTSIGENAFNNSGLITMYVSTTNKLSLTPGTVTRYGKTFTVIALDNADVNPVVPICFPVGATVATDQGDIDIEKLNPKVHTIRGKKIVSITKSTPVQKIFYNGKMVSARDLIEGYQGATVNNGKIIYIVLLKSIRR